MSNEEMIKRLRQLEAQAECLREQCCITRKMLEADSSATSTRNGELDDLVARVVAKRNMTISAKAQAVHTSK